jgi:predicted GH43/DUF377 family glycosyl hydrolase
VESRRVLGRSGDVVGETYVLRDDAGRISRIAATTWEQVVGVGQQVSTANDDLAGVQAELAARGAQIDQLKACLEGVKAAADRSRAGDVAGAVAALQSVIVPCRNVDGVSGGTSSFPYDFPDPAVVRDGSTYYAYATNSAGGAVQLITSTDLVDWTLREPALSTVAGWGRPGATWAPSVIKLGATWFLYYTVRDRASGKQCVSVATAGSPSGPFVDRSAAPIVCDLGQGGSIDANPFIAPDGVAYLLWKSEGETVGGRSRLWSQALALDGLSVTGTPAQLIQTDQGWEGRTVEGPTMYPVSGGFLLLYSANNWQTDRYTIGAAMCDTVAGPCHKFGPVLGSSDSIIGPGGPHIFVDGGGRVRVAYHAWNPGAVGYPNNRVLHVGSVSVQGGTVVVSP